MAYKTFQNGYPLPASDLNNYLMNQSVIVFADVAARTAALPTPVEGMVTYLEDDNTLYVYTGADWVALGSPVTTEGDLIIGDVGGSESRLAIGTAGKVLTSNGTTASWEDAAGGVSVTNSVIFIRETQSVTLASPHFAICLGGGGAGGGILANASQASAGGGGSGYLATGTVAAGTYTATIGAGGLGVSEADGGNGGTTSISTVSASGGDGGQAVTVTGTAGNGGNGGSGGAPGIVSAASVSDGEANKGGYNGGDAEIIYTGTSGTAGTSSGVTAESFGTIGYSFIQPALFGAFGATTQLPGNYAAGGGRGISSATAGGVSTTAFGAGGGGSRGDTAVAAAVAGGDGGNGIIILVEL